MYSVKLSVDCG